MERKQDEVRAASSLISKIIRTGISPNEIFVIHHPAMRFVAAGSSWQTVEAKVSTSVPCVRTSTFETVTGLEAPYVIVLGLRELFESEDDPSLGADRPQRLVDNTGKVYVAFTRAGFRLIATWSGPSRPEWFQFARVVEERDLASTDGPAKLRSDFS